MDLRNTTTRKKISLLVIGLLFFNLTIFSQTTFTEDASSFGINAKGSKDGGHAWADFDNDGDLDLLVCTSETGFVKGSKLYRNNGNNTFTDVTQTLAPQLDDRMRERQAVWGDLNNDGYSDFMVNTSFPGLVVFLQDPATGIFGDGYGGVGAYIIDNNNGDNPECPGTKCWEVENHVNAEGAGFFDLEGDGDLDIFFDNHDYGVEIMLNNQIDHTTHTNVNPNHNDLFTHLTTPANTGSSHGETGDFSFGINQQSTDGDYSVVADVNDDGWVDLFNRKRDENDFFLNQGGFFINGEDLAQAKNSNKGANGLWDLDNDGDLDAVWTDNDGNKIWRNDGPGVWTLLPIGTLSIGNNTDVDGLTGGDIDNDGDIDLFFSGNNRSYLYINNINSPVGNVNSGSAFSFTLDSEEFNKNQNGEGSTMVDVDDDGDLDIYMNIGGQNQLWINNLSGTSKLNHIYVHVAEDRAADGTLAGHLDRSALGANVVIKDCEGNVVSGIRDVGGAYGHGTQLAEYAHFGLPLGADELYIIEVHYPNRYKSSTGQIERLIASAVVTPSSISGTNHYYMTTDLAESLENPNAPVATNDEVTLCEDQNVDIDISVFGNDSDADGDDLILDQISVDPAMGTATITDAENGIINFAYNGAAPLTDVTFTYVVRDNGGGGILCPANSKNDSGVVTINVDKPSAPTVNSSVAYCLNETAATLTASGSNLLWYTNATGGVGSTTAPTPSTLTTGTTTYYVSQTNANSCESNRSSITVTVNALPLAPTVNAVTYCEGDTAVALTAGGSNLLWYSNSSGGTGNSTAPTPSTAVAGTTSYYVSQTNANSCESDRVEIIVTVNPSTAATVFTVGATTVCQDAANETYTATATNSTGIVYSVSPGAAGTINASTGVMNWSAGFSGTATITATSTGLCGTTSADRVVTVNPSTAATVFTAGATTVCQDAVNETYTATATNSTGIVYSVSPAGAGTINGSTGVMNWSAGFSGTATITATSTGLCGTTSADRVVTVNPSTVATVFTAGATTVCQDAVNETYTATATNSTGIVYSVSPAGAGTINGSTGVMNWSAGFSGTATITATSTGLCGTTSADRVVTVNPSTAATVFTAGATTVCQDAVNETYTATATNSTGIVYSVSPAGAGTINGSTGVMNWSAGFSGTATITATSTGLCGTTSADRVVTVNPLPIGSNDTYTINSGDTLSDALANNVNISGNTFSWYATDNANVLGETLVASTVSAITDTLINTSGIVQTVVYTVTPTSVGSCLGSDFTITVNINPNTGLTIVKSANVSSIDEAGDVIIYTVTVSNTGDGYLTGVTVTDPLVSLVLQSGDSNNNSILESSEVWVYEGSYTVLQADIDSNGGGDGDIDNTATVNVNEIGTSQDSSVAVPINLDPGTDGFFTTVKTANVTEITAPGDIEYT
ncbi:Repeat domain-containing protein, partial [Lutibacter oricola]